MSLLRFYIRYEKLILPTVAETDAGFYVDQEPIAIFDIACLDDWKRALYLALAAGNQLVPTPERSPEPGSSMLEMLEIKKWSTFEASAIMYTVCKGSRYVSVYKTSKSKDGMWSSQNIEPRKFDAKMPLSLLVNHLVEDVIKQPEANRQKTSLMLAPQSD